MSRRRLRRLNMNCTGRCRRRYSEELCVFVNLTFVELAAAEGCVERVLFIERPFLDEHLLWKEHARVWCSSPLG